MDIIAARQNKRQSNITMIVASLRNAFAKNLEVSYEKLVEQVEFSLMCSRRHAMELIDVALQSIKYDEYGKGKFRMLLPKIKIADENLMKETEEEFDKVLEEEK